MIERANEVTKYRIDMRMSLTREILIENGCVCVCFSSL